LLRLARAPAGHATYLHPVRPEYHTARLHLRAWTAGDAPAFKAAVDESLDHLRPWLPWAAHEPSPARRGGRPPGAFAAEFVEGRWWGYGAFVRDGAGPDALVGSVGVHPPRRPGQPPSVREISYWLRASATGRGYMTEAAGALVDATLGEPGVLSAQILVDPENEASARIPERLGFTVREHRVADRVGRDGRALDTVVWERRADAPLRAATPADLARLFEIRYAVRENRLTTPDRVTEADYLAAIARGTCWVWEDGDGVQGFASGDPRDDAQVWALFVHPEAEGRGAGSALLACVTDVLWARGHRRLTLTTAPGTRADRLYRAAGWTAVGDAGGEVVFRRDM
jgi:RimJ/RimL family protein N-acetyltransferase